jgi:prepilin-type N-terminal cleavage/methylation domain-containing protein
MRRIATAPRFSSEHGFTLVEMIVVTLLLLVAMLGLLAVFDASARINKNETDLADAQGAVRYGIYQMTRVIRMAGAGGLYVTQAVLNHSDPALPGILPNARSYDNVSGMTVTDQTGTAIRVKDGTDVIEIRGVIQSPLLGFDQQTGCGGCTGAQALTVLPIVGNALIGQHVNDDATNRPQFSAIDAYTADVSSGNEMLVVVEDGNSDLHSGCSDPVPGGVTRYPQSVYNVGVINTRTDLGSGNTFGTVDFGGTIGPRFNAEMPSLNSPEPAAPIAKVRRAGVLDDIVFFIGLLPNSQDPNGDHPYLAQGVRRGDHFVVTTLAEDVEDMQVAYGVDSNGDSAISRLCPVNPPDDGDPNVSTIANCDEWQPNVTGEAAFTDVDFQSQNPFTPQHTGGALAAHCPRLHGVMVSVLAKARDADPTYRGPAAQGYKIMNSTAVPVTGNHRRRVQTVKINLRNYAFQG